MRVVSLLPAATEWVGFFGAEALLVGRSHACDYPAPVRDLPVLTRPALPAVGDSAAIDAQVRNQLKQGLSMFDVDLEQLKTLRPDLILTQAQCKVCAVAMPQMEAALAAWTGARPQLFSMEPYTLRQALDAALHLGKALGCIEQAIDRVGAAEVRLRRFRDRLGLTKWSDMSAFPTIACIEWMEPLMTASHWMPDVAEMGGGRAVLAEPGERSSYVEWEALRKADPDVIAVMPCGFSIERTLSELHYLTERDGWSTLKAVRNGRVYLFDGNAYFNRPGPRLYRSIELLARALHPDVLANVATEAWEMVALTDLG